MVLVVVDSIHLDNRETVPRDLVGFLSVSHWVLLCDAVNSSECIGHSSACILESTACIFFLIPLCLCHPCIAGCITVSIKNRFVKLITDIATL